MNKRGLTISILIVSVVVVFAALILSISAINPGINSPKQEKLSIGQSKINNTALTDSGITSDAVSSSDSSSGGGGSSGGAAASADSESDVNSPYLNTPSSLPYILLYHGIVTGTPTAIEDIQLSNFTAQMKWLYDNGYNTIQFKDYFLTYNKEISDKEVMLFFDDGLSNFITNALPVLQMYNFTATIGIVTSWAGIDSNYMSWENISYCYNQGIEIASHGANHINLMNLTYINIVSEVNESRNVIQSHSIPVYSFIYPYGTTNSSIENVVKNSGYIGAREVGGLAYNVLPSSHICSRTNYTVCSLEIQNKTTLSEFMETPYRQEFGESWESISNAGSGIRNFNSGPDDLEFNSVSGHIKQNFSVTSSGIYMIMFRVKTGSNTTHAEIETSYIYSIDDVKYSVSLGNIYTGGPFVNDLYDSAWGFQNTSDINLSRGQHTLIINTSGNWEILDYFIVKKQGEPPVYNVSITSPTTANPVLGITGGQVVSINFDFLEDSADITSDVTLNNITIGGVNAPVLVTSVSGLRDSILYDTFTTTGSDFSPTFTQTGKGNWTKIAKRTGITQDGSYVAHSNSTYCSTNCTLISETMDLSDYTGGNLTFNWGVTSLNSGDYISLDIYDGSWHTDAWKVSGSFMGTTSSGIQSINLASYNLSDDFQIRFNAKESSINRYAEIDKVNITATREGSDNPQFSYISEIGWQANVTAPSNFTGLKDLFVSASYSGIKRNQTQTGAVNYGGQCTVDNDCNDTLFCNGEEKCSGGACIAGTAPIVNDSLFCTNDYCDEVNDTVVHALISCAANDLLGINICTNIPDNNSLTFDFRNPFTSVCDETAKACTSGNSTVTSTCNVTTCGAQCDAIHSCAATECNNLDKCIGNDYYDYSNVSNTCLSGCTCENNSCGSPAITYNDSRCTQCQDDSGCSNFTKDFCAGTTIKHNESHCVSYSCVTFTLTLRECNDSLFCNGQETCSMISSSNATCSSGTAISCSANDIFGINICTNTPDSNPLTLDLRNAFTSSCEESSDSCTTGNSTITHTCSKSVCSAECEDSSDCGNKCAGNVYYSNGNCNSCSCSYQTENCNVYNGWYNTSNYQWVSSGTCIEKKQMQQEYRSYGCSTGGCTTYSTISTQWIDLGTTRNKDDGTSCSDGLYCNGAEICQSGVCVSGTAISCSANNIAGVNTCTNSPDSNPLTLDLRNAFTSSCEESSDSCTSGSSEITHTCSMSSCNAQCDSTHSCAATTCGTDGCVGNDYYDYSDVSNTCTSSCSCTANACGSPAITINDSTRGCYTAPVCKEVCAYGSCWTVCS